MLGILKALVGDDEKIISEFLYDFRASMIDIAAELRAACTTPVAGRQQTSSQASASGALAHKLRSASYSMGAMALGELCAEMERAGKAGDMKALETCWPDFEKELACVQEFIDNILNISN